MQCAFANYSPRSVCFSIGVGTFHADPALPPLLPALSGTNSGSGETSTWTEGQEGPPSPPPVLRALSPVSFQLSVWFLQVLADLTRLQSLEERTMLPSDLLSLLNNTEHLGMVIAQNQGQLKPEILQVTFLSHS